MSGNVFVSYARRSDRTYVERLCGYLAESGVAVWFDAEIMTGDRWYEVIRHQIDTCATFVVVMSPEAEASTWVNREISHAEHLGKPIRPLLLAGRPFFRLSEMHYEDVTGKRMPSAAFVSRLRDEQAATLAAAPATVPPPRSHSWRGRIPRRVLLALAVTVCLGAAGLILPGLLSSSIDAQGTRLGTRPAPLVSGSPTPSTEPVGTSAGSSRSPVSAGPAGPALTMARLVKRESGLDQVNAITFVPGTHLMVTAGNDGAVRLWDVTVPSQPAQRWSLPTADGQSVASVAVSPDRKTLAIGSFAHLYLWDITILSSPRALPDVPTSDTMNTPVSAVKFCSTAPLMATSQADKVSLWNVADPAQPRRLWTGPAHDSVVNDLAFSPDGRTLVDVSGDNRGFAWDITKPDAPTQGTPLDANNGSMEGAAFRADGKFLVTASMDGTVIAWRVVGPGLLSRVATIPNESAPARSVAFRSDNLLAIGRDNASVSLWNLSNPEKPTRTQVLPETATVIAVAFSPDGQTLASSTRVNENLSLWTFA
jgi:WD40 repeat protein